jgi:Subtilase family
MAEMPLTFWRKGAIAFLLAVPLAAVEFSSPLELPAVARAYADDDDDDGGGRGRGRGPRFLGGLPFRIAVPNRVVTPNRIVRPNEIVAVGLSVPQIDTLLVNGYQITARNPMTLAGAEIVKLRPPRGISLASARTRIRAMAPVAVVDINHFYRPNGDIACGGRPCVAPGLVGWPGPDEGQDRCNGSGTRIGLIDTAINPDHAAFAESRIEVIQLHGDAKQESGSQHGTAVASLLVGTGETGTPGLVPGAELIAVDAFKRVGRDNDRSEAYDLARAIDLIVARNVDVVNMSLSGPDNGLLAAIIKLAADKGVTFVAAAGNGGPGAKPVYPAAYEEVLAVTAVDRQKNAYRRANRGEYIDLAAPGVGVWTATATRGARPNTGTSFAAPFVTAAVSLAKSSGAAASGGDIKSVLARNAEDLGVPGKDAIFGWGLLNARGLCPIQ